MFNSNTMSSTIFLAIIVVILGSLCTTLLLRRRGHGRGPRALPPGPRPLPIIGNLHMLTSLPHRGLRALSQKYGPIMSLRLGSVPAVIISSPQAAQLVLRAHDTVFAGRPRAQSSEFLSYGAKGMAFTSYGPYWRAVRKLCTVQLLSTAKVESFAALRRGEAAALVAELRGIAAAREAVDMSKKLGELIGDISSKIILGVSSSEDRDSLNKVAHEALYLSGVFNVSDYVPFLAPFDLQGYAKSMKKLIKSIDQVLEKIIKEHEQESIRSHRHEDFVDLLLSLMNQPMNPRDDHVYVVDRTNIKAILLDMLVASFDSSATAIEWILSALMKNPKAMKKLQEELQSVVGMDRMVEEKDLEKLDYLDMVVKETFRLYPTAPLLVPRESLEDITIEGHYIPKGSRVIVNTYAIGRDKEVWSENVDEFCPERFIGSKIDVRVHQFELLPFGSGRRMCAGMNLGLANVRLVVAQLVHCFTWETPNGVRAEDIDMTEKFGLSVGRAHPLIAKPTYRLIEIK